MTNRVFKNDKEKIMYSKWRSMKTRCLNKNSNNYKNYGGRGIKICDKWLNDFEAFYQDMGDCPEGKSLDRIDNDGDYTPENCKWSTALEQRHNRRKYPVKYPKNFIIVLRCLYATDKFTTRELAEKYNMDKSTMWRYVSKYKGELRNGQT